MDIPTPITIRWLQARVGWTNKYGVCFEASPERHKHYRHAILHLIKALGKLAEVAEELDHGSSSTVTTRDNGKYLADLVVLTVRLAKEFPGGPIDLETALACRLAEKHVLAEEVT